MNLEEARNDAYAKIIGAGLHPDHEREDAPLAKIDLGRTILAALHRNGYDITLAQMIRDRVDGARRPTESDGHQDPLGYGPAAVSLPFKLDDFIADRRVLLRDYDSDSVFRNATMSQTGAVGYKATPHYETSVIGVPGRTKIGLVYASEAIGAMDAGAGGNEFNFPRITAETDKAEQTGEIAEPSSDSDLTTGWIKLELNRTAVDANVSEYNLRNPVFARAILNNTLGYMYLSAIENQLINGDGTGNNWTGLLNSATGLPSAAQSTQFGLDVITDAIDAIRAQNFEPTIIVMNPANFGALAKVVPASTDDTRRSYIDKPIDLERQMVLGKPVVLSGHLAAGTVMVLTSSEYFIAHDGEFMSFRITDSHGTNFDDSVNTIQLSTRAELAVLSRQAHRVITSWQPGKGS